MVPLFGMAGIAEAGEIFALMIGYGSLVVLGFVSIITFIARSRIAAGVALALALLVTLQFTPWDAFRPYQSDDADVHYWVREWRQFAAWWGAAMVMTVAAVMHAYRSQSVNKGVEMDFFS